MSRNALAIESKSGLGPATSRSSLVQAFAQRHPNWIVFAYLLALELLVFAPIVGKVGFYLDDWHAIHLLSGAHQNALNLIPWYFVNEPKVVNRPLEAVHFAAMYCLFGSKPFWYHIFNGAIEVVAAFLLYWCGDRLFRNRAIAAFSAAVFLLIPTHDSTHYWAVAGCVPFSLALFLGSLALTIRAAETDSKVKLALGALLYTLSNFNYEVCLPLFCINVAAVYYIARRDRQTQPIAMTAWSTLLFGAGAVAYVLYLKFLVPLIAKAWIHPVTFDAALMTKTVVKGLQAVGPEPLLFGAGLIAVDPNQFGPLPLLNVAIACLLTIAIGLLLPVSRMSIKMLAGIAAAGSVAVVASFSIFGLNAEYEPTLITIVNRINAPATIGISFVYAAGLAALFSLCMKSKSQQSARVAVSAAAAALIGFFALADIAFSKPWVLSWKMQKHVLKVAKANRDRVIGASSVILVNCPRYLRWSPVFDGVWDFQSALQVALKTDDLRADVVSERMIVDEEGVSDVSSGFMCGKFPFRKMLALVAPKSALLDVQSANDFIGVVRKEGMGFDLDRKLPTVWEQQLHVKPGHTALVGGVE